MAQVAVNGTVTSVLDPNTLNESLIITNIGNETIWLAWGTSPTVSNGTPLYPGATLNVSSAISSYLEAVTAGGDSTLSYMLS